MSNTPIEIVQLVTFEPKCIGKSREVSYFRQTIRFRGQEVSLVIYPNSNGSPPNQKQQKQLVVAFNQFNTSLDSSLEGFAPKLRKLCCEYGITVSYLSDREMTMGLKWRNIKLQPDGSYECYTSNELVTDSLDIVLGFSEDMHLTYVHFDG